MTDMKESVLLFAMAVFIFATAASADQISLIVT